MNDNPAAGSAFNPQPHCPQCGVTGVAHLISRDSMERSRSGEPWFVVVFCDQCGHVYNVLAKHTFSHYTTPRLTLPPAD